jgi:hypothetical protein
MKDSAQQVIKVFRVSRYGAGVVIAILLCCFTVQPSLAADSTASIVSAEASFRYIASTLRTFRDSGRLLNNPGIDGADLEEFFSFLSEFYAQFSRDFGADSAMCRFYTGPENSRMTIEDRAELGFSFLRDIADRVARYLAVDRDFQETMEREFGSILMANINASKAAAISNQRLPTSNFDEAARINFADTACY